jgi:hypothetical protein
MMKSFVDELTTFALSFSEGEEKLFSSPIHWVMLANGDADFHDNVIFFGFVGKENEATLVAKAPRLGENGWMLQVEYDRLTELWSCIGEEAVHFVPKPYGIAMLQERPALLLSYVPGESLTRLSRKSFWGHNEQVSALAREAALSLRALNRLTERPIERPGSLPFQFPEKAEKFRALFALTDEEDRALSELVEALAGPMEAASHKVLIQGDFWHGNMIRDRKTGRPRFVDWQFARWSVDVSMDVYFFLLAGALSATEGPVEQRARDAFALLHEWRANVIPEYLTAYGKPEHYVLLPQKYGMLLCCVEKAVRPSLEFGYSHSHDFLWRHLFEELIHWQPEP